MKKLTTWLPALAMAVLVATVCAIGMHMGAPIALNSTEMGIASLAFAGTLDLELMHKSIKESAEAMKGYIERADDSFKELKLRLTDVEQKMAKKPAGGFGGGGETKSISQLITEADGFQALREGSTKSMRLVLPVGALNTKQILSVSSGQDPLVAYDRADIIAPMQRRLTIRGLLRSTPTESGAIEYPQETSFTNNAGPQYESSPERFEGAVKNESDLAFTLQTAKVKTIAHFVTASTQVLADSAMLAEYINNRLVYGLALEEEEELLTGSGSSGTISGLMTNATAFNRGGTFLVTAIDILRAAITQVALADHVATGIVLNPADWEDIELLKDTTGQYLSVSLNVNGREVCWRLPVVVTNSMTAGQFLVGDFQMAAQIWDRQQAIVEISRDHADYFTRNLVAIRAEERLALTVYRTAGLVKGSL